jgi:multiple antibiotic resistance protein
MHGLIDHFTQASVFGVPVREMMSLIHTSGLFLSVGFLSLFTTLNPLGATAFFLSHPEIAHSSKHRAVMAKRTAKAVFMVLLLFALTGQIIFDIMGISVHSFQIAGGVFVFLVALEMLRGANVRAKTLPEEREDSMDKDDISVIPLAIPLLAGPGSITVVILTMARAQGWAQVVAVMVLVALVSTLTYYILAYSGRLLRLVGESGIRVMNRVMGLFVGAIAVEMIAAGFKAFIAGV